ncbi:MAG: right-handed parallel beta-helix repeat-containing protein, partial [Synergistaceae bacterium]|nr:right-handed parallel beta-helix repeat-containing protein [Synergistaceae bacterium]
MSNDVQVGDTVYIKEGTYILSGQIDLSSKLLHLYGGFDGTETTSSDRNFETGTILDANANSRVLKIETASTIDGFTIKGGYCDGDDSDGGGIYISYSNPIITNCTITGNNTNNGYGGGIYISYSNPIITNCTITGNNANGNTSRGGGICIENGSLTITNCTIVNNTASNNQGHEIYVNSGVTAYIKNTLIWNDEFNNAIYPGGTISYDHCAYPNADTTTNGNVNLSNLPSLVSSDNGLYLAKNNVALRNTSIIFGGVKDNTTPLFDQRGKRRGNPLSSSAMSIGAIEFYPVFSIDITGGTEINTTYGTSKTLTFNNTVASLDNEPMADYDNLNLTREYNVTWSVESDVSTISISDGVLTVGNTTPAGTYTVTVKAQANAVIYNTGITSNTASKVVTVTVAKGNITLNLTKAKDLPGGTVDTAYSSVKLSEYFTATSTLNTAAIAWSISGTLPDGLTCTD